MKVTVSTKYFLLMILIYYASIFMSEAFPMGQLFSVIPLTMLLIIFLKRNKGRISICYKAYFLYQVSFLFFCYLSRTWAVDSSLALPKVNSLIFIIIAMAVIAMSFNQSRDVNILLKAIMYGGYIVVIFMFFRYGWTGLFRLLSSESRLSDTAINSNTLGMCTSYAVVINIYYILYDKVRFRDLLLIPAIVILAVSASRKAILIVIIGVFGLFILKNIDNRRVLRSIGKVIIAIIAISIVLLVVSRLPMFSYVVSRMNNLISLFQGNENRSTSDAWIRLAYNQLGLQLFKEHPILGIGIANSNVYTNLYYGHNHYLHNNYIELLACGGIVGFALYYSVYIYVLVVLIKERRLRTSEYDLCLILLIIHLIMDYGAVTYYSKETYVYLLLFYSEAKNLLSRKKHMVVSGFNMEKKS